MSSPSSNGGAAEVAGLLRVDVLSAQNLSPAILGSLLKWTPSYSNPYVVVSLASQQFVSTFKEKTLNPTWKEQGELHVPLPSEQEVVQSMGVIGGTSGKKVSSDMNAVAAAKIGGGWKGKHPDDRRREFHACSPELIVQVFHRFEEKKAASPAAAASSAATVEPPGDKLLGSVVVPLLPCLMSSSSSHRAWYPLLDEDRRDAGQIQLALHFDVGGMAPIKGDLIRLAGYGGMEYYSKVIPAGVRLEVVETYQDQVFAQYKSIEGWIVSFEFHRNIVHVVHRPSILREAHTQLHGQITRVRQSRLLKRAEGMWLALPDTHRQQALETYQFTLFSSALLYETLSKGVTEAFENGVRCGVVACRTNGSDAFGKVKEEFVRIYWNGGAGWFYDGVVDDFFDCGPKKARGKIYSAFTIEDLTTKQKRRGSSEEANGGGVDLGYDDDEDEEDEDDLMIEDVCPEQLICPITGCPMVDPVVAADGHSYEREAILHWFSTSDISPLTGAHIPTTQVFPNFTLRKLSEEFQLAHRRNATASRRR